MYSNFKSPCDFAPGVQMASAGATQEHGDDRSVQLFAVGTTVFVLAFLYMAKKLRDRRRAHDENRAHGDGGAMRHEIAARPPFRLTGHNAR